EGMEAPHREVAKEGWAGWPAALSAVLADRDAKAGQAARVAALLRQCAPGLDGTACYLGDGRVGTCGAVREEDLEALAVPAAGGAEVAWLESAAGLTALVASFAGIGGRRGWLLLAWPRGTPCEQLARCAGPLALAADSVGSRLEIARLRAELDEAAEL